MSDFTTMEHLQERVSSYGAVLRYNFRASIYEFVDKPGVDFDEIECRLFLVDTSHKTFEDAGHAMWRVTFAISPRDRKHPLLR